MKIAIFILVLVLFPAIVLGHLTSQKHIEVVTITDKGFSPDFLRIEKGATVVWKVMGNGSFWPASNFHPTHEGYPVGGGCIGSSLDACRGLNAGESYNFTFETPGRWGMHDHLHSGLKMIVEVAGKQKDLFAKRKNLFFKNEMKENFQSPTLSISEHAVLAMNWCQNESNVGKIVETAECYAKQMENISRKYGRDFAYSVLFELQKIDKSTKTCHFIVHGIGWGLFKQNPDNWQSLLRQSRNECTYGEQMGVIELYTQGLPDGKITKDFVPSLCGENPKANCNHAVGHMLLLETQNDLPKAQDLCYGIESEEQRYHCLTGMFMERVAATNLVEHGLVPSDWTYSTMYKRINMSEELCRSFSGLDAEACWREMAHPIAQLLKGDFQKVFDYCNTAQTEKSAWACKTHVLHDLASPKRFNLTVLKPMCAMQRDVDERFEGHCYSALVNIKLNSLGPKASIDVIDFCASLNGKFKESCFISIGNSLMSIGAKREIAEDFCKDVPEQYKAFCIQGSGKRSPSQGPQNID